MAMNNLGRVAMVHRGDYSPTYDYKPLDCCYHEGGTFFCKAATTGNAPPNATYWVLMSTSASTVDRQAAEAAAQAAAGSATSAANQVTLAEAQVDLAQGHATTAGNEATAAAGSASDAAGSASQAQAFAGNAELSAGAAASSATSAANSASAAATSAASVDGPGLLAAVTTHTHDGTSENGVRINYSNLDGSPPCPYGVGDILETDNPTHPATRWPGTVWASKGPGKVLVGVDTTDTDFDAPGKTGGSKNAQHAHKMPYGFSSNHFWIPGTPTTPQTSRSSSVCWIDPVGGPTVLENCMDDTHPTTISTLPPYETAYRYKRTA